MLSRLLFTLLVVASIACSGDAGESATGATGQGTGEGGPCGGETCDPLLHYCLVPFGAVGGEEVGMCVTLPSECADDDPCPCLEALCAGGVCAESDGGWALLTCNQA